MSNSPIVRFAPSPTGHLHIGGVRTALFNYLFTKNQQGKFVLRIEDTDIARSSTQMAQDIIEGMKWLGLNWDEGPLYQSHRFELYCKTAFQLLEKEKAYRCFCTPEEIEERKNISETCDNQDRLFKYDRQCFHLTRDQINEKLEKNVPYVLRFFIPEGTTYFKDRLHKEMKIENQELEDFVILKSDNSPTYHLSVVVDDAEMGITDVIRGDDHISNTYKQILLFKALELKPPKYAHLPLILGPDKKKLSKRHGETSVLEFKRNGYLPEALINYLSQLSWIPADTKKIFTLPELINQFALGKLSKSSPVFDYDKLKYVNSRAIQQEKDEKLYSLLMEDPSFAEKYEKIDLQEKIALIRLVKPRIKLLSEFKEKFELYLSQEPIYHPEELNKFLTGNDPRIVIENLTLLIPSLQTLENFDPRQVENTLRECAQKVNKEAADFIHPSRFALTTETVSPSIFEVFQFFGKERSLKRLQFLVHYLQQQK